MQYVNDSSLDGAVFQTRTQTAGRGQYDRTWLDNPGDSILMSVLLFPPVELRRPVILTAWAAVSVVETILLVSELTPLLKWPNDLLVKGKKVCGILTESRTTLDGQLAVVCGIGVNLNQTAEYFEQAGLEGGTSLSAQVRKRKFDLEETTKLLVEFLKTNYKQINEIGLDNLEKRWRLDLGLLEKIVRIELMDGTKIHGLLNILSFENLVICDSSGKEYFLKPETIRHISPE